MGGSVDYKGIGKTQYKQGNRKESMFSLDYNSQPEFFTWKEKHRDSLHSQPLEHRELLSPVEAFDAGCLY